MWILAGSLPDPLGIGFTMALSQIDGTIPLLKTTANNLNKAKCKPGSLIISLGMKSISTALFVFNFFYNIQCVRRFIKSNIPVYC